MFILEHLSTFCVIAFVMRVSVDLLAQVPGILLSLTFSMRLQALMPCHAQPFPWVLEGLN